MLHSYCFANLLQIQFQTQRLAKKKKKKAVPFARNVQVLGVYNVK